MRVRACVPARVCLWAYIAYVQTDVNNIAYVQTDVNNISYVQKDVNNIAYVQTDVNDIAYVQTDVNDIAYVQKDVNDIAYVQKDAGSRSAQPNTRGRVRARVPARGMRAHARVLDPLLPAARAISRALF